MKFYKNRILVAASFLLLISAICFWKGFDHKNNYYQFEQYPSLNQYTYVGGDAYNYIINSNYFIGFIVLGSSAALGAVMLVSTFLIIRSKEQREDIVPIEETPIIEASA